MMGDFRDASIRQLFEAQVEQTPDAVAVAFADQTLTYQELNVRANQLAHYLQTLGIGTEVLVGICMERSLEMLVGILAIIKAGGAYVPLDPTYPQERLAYMLADTQTPVLLVQARSQEFLSNHQAQVVCIDTDWETIAQYSQENPISNVTGENLAYVMYTSGSTGKPKGVCVIHRGVVRLVKETNYASFSPEEVFLQLAPISFDASTFEIWGALLNGAQLAIMPPHPPSLQELGEAIAKYKVTTLWLTAGLFHLMVDERLQDLKTLRQLLAGGDVLSVPHVRKVVEELPGCRLINGYGPTENTTFTCCYSVTELKKLENSVPIGTAIANTEVYLLNGQLQPVPPGQPGEIYIGGAGLARGYLNRPDLTAKKFIDNPFACSSDGGARAGAPLESPKLYKTGDLARYLPDGNIEFIGRIDNQVKIRGFRIELGEIEAALQQHPDVCQAVVVTREDIPGDKRLVAYVVAQIVPDRFPLQTSCLLEFDGNTTCTTITEDISTGGIRIVGVPDSLQQGTHIRLSLQLPGKSEEMWLDGKVAWHQGIRAGIQFNFSSNQQAILEQSIEYLLETQGFLKSWQRTIAQSWRRFLKQRLPEYMVPSSFVFLKTLPLNPNGKVDRRALPLPDRTRWELPVENISNLDVAVTDSKELPQSVPIPFVAPRTAVEEKLAALWAEILVIDRVGIHDNFWEWGGNSLLAIRLISRLREAFGVDLPLRSLFDAPTVAELAEQLPAVQTEKAIAIAPISRDQNLPLAYAQQQLWFLHQLEPNIPVYNEPITIYLTEAIDVDVLTQALNAIVQRHEALRTNFTVVNGQPVQVIRDRRQLQLTVVNLQALPEIEQEAKAKEIATVEACQPFDLAQDLLLRASLVQFNETDWRLYLTLHHIIFDGVSAYNVLLPELASLYEAFSSGKPALLPELPIQYADFAAWQRQLVETEAQSHLAYWQKQLADLPVLQLPTDRPRPPVQSFRGAKQYLTLPKNLTEQLKSLSRREGVTLFTTLLSAFKTLLHRYAGQEEIVVGTVTAGRDRPELENLFGFFLNTLVLRSDFSGNPSFCQLLNRVQDVTLDAYAHQNFPYEQLVRELQPERNPSYNPLFQVMFVLEPPMSASDRGWSISQLDIDTGTAKLDLYVELDERQDDEIVGRFEYNTDLFDAATISRLIGHFETLLAGIVANPEQKLAELPLLTTTEQQQFLEWNNTQVNYPKNLCLRHLFEAQVVQTPDAVAVAFEDKHLTYQELNSRANQLAHHLRLMGVGPDVRVGICLERSLDMVVGLLGVLKAGGAYVPLDPAYPAERLAFMLEDSQMPVLLTQGALVGELLEHGVPLISLDSGWRAIARQTDKNPANNAKSDNLAYVIYTSGSTGKPKGVQIQNNSVVNFLLDMSQRLGMTDKDRLLSVTTICFDIFALELFLPLTVGATVVLASREVASDGKQLISKLDDPRITFMQATPATWRLLLASAWEGSDRLQILCGGEALPRQLADRLLERCAGLWNLYGPTEATIWATASQVEAGVPITIGLPMSNTQFYVLDAHQQPLPVGVPGELYIGGDGLARGYLNRPELNAERFIDNPFARSSELSEKINNSQLITNNSKLKITPTESLREQNSKLYRTGDLVRYLPDGKIEFLGRIDYQVKIRGFRIELGEIESVLSQHPDVQAAVVVAREDEPGNQQLVGYIVSKQAESAPSTSELRLHLQKQLPDYMVPSTFVVLAAFPLTPNGKVDRKALPAPDRDRLNLTATFVEPHTLIEVQVAGIWSKVLGIEKLGISDNFFEVGGNSLRAAELIACIKAEFQIELPLRCLFEHPTIEGLAQKIELVRQQGTSALASAIDLTADAVLAPEIHPTGIFNEDAIASGAALRAIDQPRNIFLTGGTGFLGAYLLHELLAQTDAQIYCLVRAANEQEAKIKLQKNLQQYLLGDSLPLSRIIPVIGDLSQPLLGLTAEQFDSLAQQIDIIYNNGAIVDFIQPYSRLKAANVDGTQEVLKLACQGKVKPVHHISTYSVFGTIGSAKGIKTVTEADNLDIALGNLHLGYSESKWVAEKLVWIAKSRGLPVTVYRPALMLGDSRTGICNTKDYAARLLKGCIQMGSFPELVGERKHFIPVDFASKAIVHLSRQKASLGKAFHITNPHNIYFVEFFDLISAYGYPLQKLQYAQWKDELAKVSSENAIYPLVPLHAEKIAKDLTVPELYQNSPYFECENTLNGLTGTSIVCPPVDEKLMNTYFSWLISSGFVTPPPSRLNSNPQMSRNEVAKIL